MKRPTFLLVSLLIATMAQAQSPSQEAKMAQKLRDYFATYEPKGQQMARAPKMLSYTVDNKKRTLDITADETFAAQEFTDKITENIYRKVRKALPKPYNKYSITITTNGMAIDELAPNSLSANGDKSRLWGDIDYDGEPWVKNVSSPLKITHGLQNRHIAVWASHGRYYDTTRGWRWQRPKLFCTTEDLFTQTIVVPYLIPMLENAGAVVFTPRERDWQKHEVIVDNDDPNHGIHYLEVNTKHEWESTGKKGFAQHSGTYYDGENPFNAGTARMAKTTNKKNKYSLISYQPQLPEAGRYAVYVSYQTMDNSVDDACYTVWHKGEKTEFHVNQRIGGGTWVYLGTFDFDEGSDEFNAVTVSNYCRKRGVVTADAVRFGGGMGNIERGGGTSGLPRCLEGARYYAQWAGMPYSIYGGKGGENDYKDDINVRSLMTNYLGGGSCYMPSLNGKGVPIELSLAIHSDAGYDKEGEGLIGSLAICTTNFNDGRLNSGVSRLASRDFADALLSNAYLDLKYKYGEWNKRYLYDRNYSETRLPEVPSAILETLSHQSFPDMRYGQDPNFKFTLARSIYKTVLRYVCEQHSRPYIVAPLTPTNFSVDVSANGEATLSWSPVNDPQEPTSRPTSYIVYTRYGNAGFDNGTRIGSTNSMKMKLEPGVLYSFRVAASNRGGQSFPSEELCALYNPEAKSSVLVVNGFHRLSSPAVVDNFSEQGFDIAADPGVTLGSTVGWCGQQTVFDRNRMGIEDESGLGYSDNSLTGVFVAGNDMNYVRTHAEAIQAAGRYSIASCSSQALEQGRMNTTPYRAIDLVLGLERNDGHSLEHYKSFSTSMQNVLQAFTERGSSLLVSGSYVGSDMTADTERRFLANVLKCQWNGSNTATNDSVSGLGTAMTFHRYINEKHYAATHPDNLGSLAPAYAAMAYADGSAAAVAYQGNDYRTFTMGFPFECIKDSQKRTSIMRGLLAFLIK